jgi:glutamyl-tRNA reductase
LSSRTASDIAQELGVDTLEIGDLPHAISAADVVMTSAAASRPILDQNTVSTALRARAGRPLVVIDVALPRNVDPAIRELPNVKLYDLDDLRSRIAGAMEARMREAPRVHAIIADELRRMQLRLASAPHRPDAKTTVVSTAVSLNGVAAGE